MPLAKYLSVRGASNHPTLKGKYQICSHMFWGIHPVNGILIFRSRWCVVQEGCYYGFSRKWVYCQEEHRHSMVGRFAVRHLCRGILYRKMAAWINAEVKGLFPFLVGPFSLLEVRNREESVL